MNITTELKGIEYRGKYMFADMLVMIDGDDMSIGCTTVSLHLPVENRDQSLFALREELLALVQASIHMEPILAWMKAMESH